MANSRDFTGKNRKFTGTKGIVVAKGTTEERVGAEPAELRFNTTLELMEYYDGTQWKPIDAPPTISNITTSDGTGTNTILNADGSTLYTITINGGNFSLTPTVKFKGNTGTEYTATNVTRVSASQITCKTINTMGTTDDPYDVIVVNTSGLSATLDDAFSYNAAPVFVNASGQLAVVYSDGSQTFSGSTINAGATDAEGNAITHTIISGSLPSGLSIASSTGYITGTVTGSPATGNYPFVVRAATTEGTVERQFSLQLAINPFVTATGGTVLISGDFKTHVFTSPGTFTVSNAGNPSGSTTVEYLVVGAGGSGSGSNPGPNQFDYAGGGGGAGGYRQNYPSPATGGFPVSATSYPITVGASGGAPGVTQRGVDGNPSIFSTITSTAGGGGGSGGSASSFPGGPGSPGGSGGGGGGSGPSSGGTGNSPPVSPSQGNPGGPGFSSNPTAGGGGGGAGASGNAGTDTSPAIGGPAGVGSPIADAFFGPTAPSYGTPGPAPGRYFAGGGGGAGGYNSNPGRSGIGGSGGGGNGAGSGGPSPAAVSGTTNTGGGGGGAQTHSPQGNPGGAGGSGIVAIRYKFQ